MGDASGFCEFANESLARSLGVPLGSILGIGWQQLLPSEDRVPLLARLSQLASHRQSFRTRIRVLTSARMRTLKAHGIVLNAQDNTSKPRILLTLHDITYTQRVSFRRQLRAEQLRVCFEQTPVGMAFLDTSFRIVRANPFLSPLLCVGRSPLEGRPLEEILAELIHAESWSELLRACSLTLENGSPHVLSAWPLGKLSGGRIRFTDWEIRRIETTENIPIGLLLTISDVTRTHEYQEELSRAHENLEQRVQERTTELARANTIIKDRANQQATVAELGAKALSGVPSQTLFEEASQLILSILHVDFCSIRELTPDHQHLILRGAAGWPPEIRLDRLSAGTQSQSGFTILSHDPVIVEDMDTESRFEISQSAKDTRSKSSVSVALSFEKRPFGTISAFSRERRKFTKEDTDFLLAVANVLAASIQRQRAEEGLRKAREQAEGANRAKSEFLSRMSHELRTPLNAILGFAQLLEMDAPNPRQKESISHIGRAGKHLLGLINEVLEISRIEASQLELLLEPVELSGFIQPCLELLAPLAARTSIQILFKPSPSPTYVRADRQKLKQVVLNLLSNAIKYNRPDGRVNVEIKLGKSSTRFLVSDTGPGISDENRAQLFTPFHRLGAEKSEIEGSGLGLSLCKRLLEAMQGSIGLEPPTSEGCVFWAELPNAHPSDPSEKRLETAQESPPF